MHLKFIVLCLSALALCQLSDAKKFTKCSLAVELSRLGIAKPELPDWICIAEFESSFNTDAMNTNTNGSKDWGIFQINDKWWCNPEDGRPTFNSCNIPCTDLKQDDITIAVRCAQQIIKERKGYSAWNAWNKHCQGTLPKVDECF